MKWYENPVTKITVAYWLVDVGLITELNELLHYFEKPWKWDNEYETYRKTLE